VRPADVQGAQTGAAPEVEEPVWQITRAERIDRTTVLLALAGEFDLAAYEPVGEVLRGLEDLGAPVVVIDLEQVNFVGPLVLGFLVKAQERADMGGWALVIVAPRDPAHRLVGLTGHHAMNILDRPPCSGYRPRARE
jgi:anti-anti-sigma factor